MKKLLILISSVFCIAFNAITQDCPTNLPYTKLGYGCFSNVLCTAYTNTWSASIWPAFIALESPSGNPSITLRRTGIGGPPPNYTTNRAIIAVSSSISQTNTLLISDNLIVTGDIQAIGNVYGTSNILWQTNMVFATNSTYATNDQYGFLLASTNFIGTNLVSGTLINYATNAQTTTVDMSIPYGDVDVAGGITFAGLSNTKDTAYQTAVVFVKNTTGVEASIVIPTAWTNTAGPLRVTNYTICTIFRNPGRFTNIVTLPVW